jgi:hypothetical protein
MTTLKVKVYKDRMDVTYPADHKQKDDIERWLKNLSPGYAEWMLQVGSDPHCSNCRDMKCENFGRGDDACPAFQFGEKW